MSAARGSAAHRLMKELGKWKTGGCKEEGTGIERLGPVDETEMLKWEAVINGRGVGSGYDAGRWLLTITVPLSYPLAPPTIVFSTPIVHPNIALDTGEICLDLLKKDGWSGTYTIVECVKAIRLLLSLPEVDSPLNVDIAALIRGGDGVGARSLVEFWCREERYGGR